MAPRRARRPPLHAAWFALLCAQVPQPPPWVESIQAPGASPTGPSFLVVRTATWRRVLRDGRPWCTPEQLPEGATLVRAEAAGDDAVVTVARGAPPFAVMRCRPGAPASAVVDSDVAAAVTPRGTLLYARGSVLFERPLVGGADRARRRFATQTPVARVDAFPDGALVLTARLAGGDGDVYALDAPAPVLRGVSWTYATPDGWVVNARGANLHVAGDGRVRPLDPARDREAPPYEEASVSAAFSIDAEGRTARRTPWVAVRRGAPGAITVVRDEDEVAAVWRESPEAPWRTLDDARTPWGPAAIPAEEVRVSGPHLVARSGQTLRVWDGAAPARTVADDALAVSLDGDTLWWRTHRFVWTSQRLDAPAAPPTDDAMRFDGHALAARGDAGITLDGRRLPFAWPTDMQGEFGVVVDGAFPVPGAGIALLTVGRQSSHGGHFVYDRLLAVDLRDGAVRRLSPAGAWPLGFDARANYGRWVTLAAGPRGAWLHDARRVLLAPLDGSPPRVAGPFDRAAMTPTISRDATRVAFAQGGRVVAWDASPAATAARTGALRSPAVRWAPRGRGLVVASPDGTAAVTDDGEVLALGCARAAPEGVHGHVRAVLPGARAALVCDAGRLAVAAPGRCIPVPALPCDGTSVVPWAAERRPGVP
ncbi:MAG: hypothetical protein U0324_09525 [Polyangiales bacterium]